MPRLYHSASSIALIQACPRRAAYRYIAGIREPEVEWSDIEAGRVKVLKRNVVPKSSAECTPKQKSAALGKQMHRYGDDYYHDLAVPWETLPGQVLASGLHLLPEPRDCDTILTEASIGIAPSGETPERIAKGCPPTAFEVLGMLLVGNRDLLLHVERPRLDVFGAEVLRALDASGGWLQADHKSTASIAKYAKRPADLAADVQCATYTLEALEMLARIYGVTLDRLPSRWVYYETKEVRRAAPCDVVLSRDQCLDILAPCAKVVAEFNRYTRVEDAPQNPRDCESYNSLCPYHIDAGGTCRVRRSLGSSIQHASRPKGQLPIMDPSVQAKFEAMKRAREAKAGGAAAPVAEATIDDLAGEPTAPVVVTKPARAPRKPKPAAVVAPPEPEETDDASEEIVDEIAEAEAADAELDTGTPRSASDLLELAGKVATIDDEIAVLQDRRTAALDALEAAVTAAR